MKDLRAQRGRWEPVKRWKESMFRSDAGTIQSHQVNRDCVRHPLRDSEDHLYEIKLCKKLRELVERKSFIQEVDGSSRSAPPIKSRPFRYTYIADKANCPLSCPHLSRRVA
jgi:hypothetical protein